MSDRIKIISKCVRRAVWGSLVLSGGSYAIDAATWGDDGVPSLQPENVCLEPGFRAGCWEIPDQDGDGVLADRDQCPDTPPGVAIDAHGCPMDTDRDGVADNEDRCPSTLLGARVDGHGCPLDLDGDGVPYYADRCPTTPPGAEVDAQGCTIKFVLQDVNFEFNQTELSTAAQAQLQQLIHSLAYESDVMGLRVSGHTDHVGTEAYNQQLSEMRARVVLHYLQTHHVTLPIATFGFGYSQPLASNKTAAGRAKNRRVEIEVERAQTLTRSE